MSWLDRLVKASFRGLEFLSEAHEAKLGRRLVIHEFPGAEEPLVEDLGGKAAELHLTAYFIGADYDLQRNKLLALLNKTGSDWLEHPWLGRLEVRAKEWSLSESTDKGGYCTVSIDFVPAGMVVTTATTDVIDTASAQLVTLSDNAQLSFLLSVMSTDAVTAFIKQGQFKFDTLQDVVGIAALPASTLPLTQLIKTVKNDFVSLLTTPPRYVSAVRTLIDSVLLVDSKLTNADRPRVVSYLTELATRYPIHPKLLTMTVAATSALELPINIDKDNALQACFLISVAGQLALTQYRTREDRDAACACVLTAIDWLLPVLTDDVFQAAVSARVAVYEALMAQDLDPTQQREVFTVQPSTVLAYRFELLGSSIHPSTSSGRTDDFDDSVFIAINAVRHPLFVQGVIYG